MSTTDSRIDAYIEKAAPFAQPILNHIRDLIHEHCPGIQENIKWGFPHFDYKGKSHFSLAAFKQHCAFGFWLAGSMKDPKGILQLEEKSAMGSLGKITTLKDLPPDKVFAAYLKDSIRLADEGVKVSRAPQKKAVAPPLETPEDFRKALSENKKAQAIFEQFAPSHRKEYLEWILEAKREETRAKRIAQALEWMAEGKPRHWKYHG
ncbi:YdeI/OmpD-associated family protein [Taibaiella koreensis]|uniref:YdeI/OmpD-associated family protein n=1 Tax=Taibaiella koreensis TaxID=1268548 RepID=UPI000E59F2B0|nr:YdeI/OmpD-associated family protein [Taibaiella koreensis]